MKLSQVKPQDLVRGMEVRDNCRSENGVLIDFEAFGEEEITRPKWLGPLLIISFPCKPVLQIRHALADTLEVEGIVGG